VVLLVAFFDGTVVLVFGVWFVVTFVFVELTGTVVFVFIGVVLLAAEVEFVLIGVVELLLDVVVFVFTVVLVLVEVVLVLAGTAVVVLLLDDASIFVVDDVAGFCAGPVVEKYSVWLPRFMTRMYRLLISAVCFVTLKRKFVLMLFRSDSVPFWGPNGYLL